MKNILFVILVAMLATVASARDIPWADHIIRTNPVLEKGLGPEMVTSGYELATLTSIGRDGEDVTRYESWTSGRSGGRVECAFRPGEAVEARKTGVRTVTLSGRTFEVETWVAKRLVRCGNPTSITFYRWFEAKTVTKTVTVTEPAKDIDVHADVKVAPIKVDANVNIAPIKVDADVNVKPIKVDVKVDQSAAPAPQVTVNNVTNNFTTNPYPSGQMMGVYGATVVSSALMSVGWSSGGTKINIKNINWNTNWNENNNSNSNSNANGNTNVVNVGDGTASGSTDASGNSAATSGQ